MGEKNKDDLDVAKGFKFFTSRLGLEEIKTIQLGSPFNYSEQAAVYIESYLPESQGHEKAFITGATEAIKKYLLQTQGKAFILFTSFKQLNEIAQKLETFCHQKNFMLLVQGFQFCLKFAHRIDPNAAIVFTKMHHPPFS